MLHSDAADILRHSNVYIARAGKMEGRKKKRKERRKEQKGEQKRQSKKNKRKEEEVKFLLKSLSVETKAYIFLLPIP